VAAFPTKPENVREWRDAELAGTGVEEQQKKMAEGQTPKQWEEEGCNTPPGSQPWPREAERS